MMLIMAYYKKTSFFWCVTCVLFLIYERLFDLREIMLKKKKVLQ